MNRLHTKLALYRLAYTICCPWSVNCTLVMLFWAVLCLPTAKFVRVHLDKTSLNLSECVLGLIGIPGKETFA